MKYNIINNKIKTLKLGIDKSNDKIILTYITNVEIVLKYNRYNKNAAFYFIKT